MRKVRLKKDWPPFPANTVFEIKKGCTEEMLCSPTFGEMMPNGQLANGIIPRNWTEYNRMFDHVGGFHSWFEEINEESEHLEFIYNRLVSVHSEKENIDYMRKLKEIIDKMKTNKIKVV